jgi:hypothetical protein
MLTVLSQVESLEKAMEGLPQADCPIEHHFAPNVYVRQMCMPADVVLTGASHKTEHLCILAKGRVKVVNGEDQVEYTAPAIIKAGIGTKRAIWALEDSVWFNIHPTATTDLDALVEELTESSADELAGGANNQQLQAFTALQIKEN